MGGSGIGIWAEQVLNKYNFKFFVESKWIFGTEALKGNAEANISLGALSISEVIVQG